MAERRRRGGGGGLFPAGYEQAQPAPTEPPASAGPVAGSLPEAGDEAPDRFEEAVADAGNPEAGYAEDEYVEEGYIEEGYVEAPDVEPGFPPRAGHRHQDLATMHTGEQEAVDVGDVQPHTEYGYAGATSEEAGAEGEGGFVDAGSIDDGARYDPAGYDAAGYDAAGYDAAGYDAAGYDAAGYDAAGYDAGGYDENGYDEDGYDEDGYYDDEWDDGGHPVRHRAAVVGRRHPFAVGFVLVVLVLLLLAGAGILWASRQINPGGHNGADVTVRIPSGASTAQIGSALAKAGVIHSSTLFRYYTKIQGSGALLSGTYVLPRNESYDEAIAALQKGPAIVADKLVVPEGFTLHEIAHRVAALPGMHLSAAKFLALSHSGSVRSALEPKGVNDLEGLVYAATYTIDRTDTESDILEEMVGDFEQHMQAMGLAAGAAKLHMTPYQVITVASIVQGEAKDLDQFPDTASVIYNRLSTDMTLGADSTLIYALRLRNPALNVKKVDPEEPSPYNTRLHKGLPPSPIDNPSLPALAAAISPPHTDLEYFVEINPDGQLGFASTNSGFLQLTNTCKAHGLC